MLNTFIDCDTTTGEYEGYVDNILVCTAPSEEEASKALAQTVASLRELPREVYTLAIGYMFLDDQLSLRQAVDRAERAFARQPVMTRRAVAA